LKKADIPFLTASDLAGLIKEREVSPVEAVEAYLDRIEALNDKLYAYLTVCREEALQAARNRRRPWPGAKTWDRCTGSRWR